MLATTILKLPSNVDTVLPMLQMKVFASVKLQNLVRSTGSKGRKLDLFQNQFSSNLVFPIYTLSPLFTYFYLYILESFSSKVLSSTLHHFTFYMYLYDLKES